MKDETIKSGFIPRHTNWDKFCKHPNHNPPGHIVVPNDKIYRHVCPACGSVGYIHPFMTTL